MLMRLLDEIRSRGTQDPHSLAARLGTTPEMVKALLEHLQRSGYLHPYTGCAEGCGACSLQADCAGKAQGQAPRLWALNEKGKE